MENQEQDLREPPRAQLERIPAPSATVVETEIAPAVDAWLERRLRVFERALAQLEARHQKIEQDQERRIALLEERLAAYEKRDAAPVTSQTTPAANAAAPAPVSIGEGEILFQRTDAPPKPIGDFLTHARHAANSAVPVMAEASRRKDGPRWMAWAAVGCAAAMTVTALALGTVAGASETAGAVSHRQMAQSFGRVIALADSGDPRDQTSLALAYLRGQHFAPDHAAAGRWALAAAQQGDPVAQYLMGAFYQSGDGVAADPAEAFHWFEASALRGNLKAMHNLAIAYAQGLGTDKNPERAAAWFNRAALEGYKDSQFDLAVLYERGDGVMQNPERALKWYLIASRAGDNEAQSRAGELEKAMSAADVTAAETEAAEFVPTAHDLLANSL
jgi:localization factor PodJL